MRIETQNGAQSLCEECHTLGNLSSSQRNCGHQTAYQLSDPKMEVKVQLQLPLNDEENL